METLTDLIAYAAELSLDKLGRSCGMRRVIETDMQALAYLPRKRRTALVGSPTHGNDVIPRLIQIGTDTDRSMAADVDPSFLHHFHGLGIDLCGRFRSAGIHLQRGVKRLQETMSHLAAATVSRAKYQNSHNAISLVKGYNMKLNR